MGLDLLDLLAIAVINAYQRFISPYKGFCCAYHYHTGHASCSEFARKVVIRHGIWVLWKAMPRQFSRCKAAYTQLLSAMAATNTRFRRENRRSNRNRQTQDYSDCISCDGIDACSNISHCDVIPCDCSW